MIYCSFDALLSDTVSKKKRAASFSTLLNDSEFGSKRKLKGLLKYSAHPNNPGGSTFKRHKVRIRDTESIEKDLDECTHPLNKKYPARMDRLGS